MKEFLRIRFYVGLSNRAGKLPIQLPRLATSLLESAYEGGTFFYGTGVWKGDREQTLVFETLCPDLLTARPRAEEVAGRLALRLGQEAVLLTVESVDGEFVPGVLPAQHDGGAFRETL